jgi:phage/plasmid-like protein (TIGR03299 family)
MKMAHDYNAQIIVGKTAQRSFYLGGKEVVGTYEGSIPVQAIKNDLLNWQALEVPSASLVPVGVEDADGLLPDGTPYKTVIQPGKKAIVRSDNFQTIGYHSEGWQNHVYDGLMDWTSNMLQGGLDVSNALTRKGGAQFALTLTLDSTMHDGKSGLEFLPELLVQTSMDGSLATTFSAGNRVIICDNMFQAVHRAAKKAGRQHKIKHTRNSLSLASMQTTRDALAVMELSAVEWTEFVGDLVDVPLTRSQWFKALDILIPAAGDLDSKAKQTKTANRREAVTAVYTNDPMAAPWTGTAFGAVQAFNTYTQRHQSVRGTGRLDRNFDRAMRGDFAAEALAVLEAVSTVVERDLVPA